MRTQRTAIAIGLGVAALLIWRLWPEGHDAPREAAAVRTSPGLDVEPPGITAARPSPIASEHRTEPSVRVEPELARPETAREPGDDEAEYFEFSDVEYYADRPPMSPVPHAVVRGWGARGGGRVPGIVGVYVVVDPSISNESLEELARDIRDYHYDAAALSIRIFDSEHAATYDRHSDGGALAADHLVATVNRNDRFGTARTEIRGAATDMGESEQAKSR